MEFHQELHTLLNVIRLSRLPSTLQLYFTVYVGTFDPFVERNSFVAVDVAVSQEISSTFSGVSVVSAQ